MGMVSMAEVGGSSTPNRIQQMIDAAAEMFRVGTVFIPGDTRGLPVGDKKSNVEILGYPGAIMTFTSEYAKITAPGDFRMRRGRVEQEYTSIFNPEGKAIDFCGSNWQNRDFVTILESLRLVQREGKIYLISSLTVLPASVLDELNKQIREREKVFRKI